MVASFFSFKEIKLYLAAFLQTLRLMAVILSVARGIVNTGVSKFEF